MIQAKRFWKSVGVAKFETGYGVTLDDRPVRTPAKADLHMPTRAAAELVAGEWSAVEDGIDPNVMPATRWANSAIDKVTPQRSAVVDMLADYGGSDLLCYRATGPQRLIEEQAAAWDGPLDWARDRFDAPLVVTSGLVPVAQPEKSLSRLRAELDAFDPFGLAAVHDLVMLSGSLVLGLLVAHQALDADSAWAASRVDEDWQARQWGEDQEAKEAAAAKQSDFLHAARFLATLI